MNYPRVVNILGSFTLYFSSVFLLPALCAAIVGDGRGVLIYLACGILGGALGLLGRRSTRGAPRALHRREGLLVVVGWWVTAVVLGSLPFLLSGATTRFEDALFESMSGFTTTGATVFAGLDAMPRALLFWRSLTHWLGGVGIVVLFVAVLPALGVGGRLLYQFEVPGVEKEDLKPRIRETALLIWKIYLLLSVVLLALLLALGVDLFDALIHTFGTVSTGGFSSHDASMAHFPSRIVRGVVLLFMVLCGTNFTLFWRARREGLRVFLRDPELKAYLGIIAGLSSLIFIVLLLGGGGPPLGRMAMGSVFQVVSLMTTTGFVTVDFDRWPDLLRGALVALMFVGGCAGSTAGGFKVFRVLILIRVVGHEARRFIRPHRVSALMVGKEPLTPEIVRSVLIFFVALISLWLIGTLTLAGLGLDLVSAASGTMTALANVGPGLGTVGPMTTFADVPSLGKILLTFLMLFGRLEVFTFLAVFLPGLYRD